MNLFPFYLSALATLVQFLYLEHARHHSSQNLCTDCSLRHLTGNSFKFYILSVVLLKLQIPLSSYLIFVDFFPFQGPSCNI
jgi:hypothetical protein